ncbi:MAG: hypothetical protein Q8R29_00715, partial [bacterium]|nr:hypothetical protein [bacterium]
MKIVTNYKLQITSFLFLAILLFPVFVFAQADQSIWAKGIVPCKGLDCSVCDVFELVSRLIRLLWSGAALVGTVAFMYGGFLYWRGKPAEAKKVLTNVVIGIAIAFLAWIGIDTIIKLLITQRFTGPAAEL